MEITENFTSKPFIGFSGIESNSTSDSLHYHNFSQILLIEKGVSLFESDGSSFVQTGMVYIPKNFPHRSTAMKGTFHYRSLYFLDPIGEVENNSPMLFQPSLLVTALIKELTEENSIHANHAEKCYDLLINSLSEDIKKQTMHLRAKSSLIKHALQIMTQNAHLPNCLEIVNSHHPYSSRHFARLFFNETGHSLRDAWTIIRMELARTQLKNGNSILETSLAFGYSSLSGFYRDYKRVFKTTPKKIFHNTHVL